MKSLATMLLLAIISYPATTNAVDFAFVGTFGLGGEGEMEVEEGGSSAEDEGDFEASMGFGMWLDFAVSENVALGLDVRAIWWNMDVWDDYGVDRSMMIEFGPSLRFGLEPAENLNLYLRLAPGVSIIIFNEDLEEGGFDLGVPVGFDIAGFAGIKYMFSQVGVVLELGAIYHMVFGDIEYGGASAEYTLDGAQFHINIGLCFG